MRYNKKRASRLKRLKVSEVIGVGCEEVRAKANAQRGANRASHLEGLLHGSEVVGHANVVHPALLVVGRIGPAGDGLGREDLRHVK